MKIYKLFALDVSAWYGACAPAGVAKNVLGRLNTAMVDALRQPEIRERLMVSVLILAQHHARIVAAQAKRVGQRHAHIGLARHIGHVIQVAFGIGRFVVDSGMNGAGLNGLHTDRTSSCAGRACAGARQD